jgi:hypothetical protein
LDDYRVLQPNNDFLGNRPRNRSEHHVGMIRSLQIPTCIRILGSKTNRHTLHPHGFRWSLLESSSTNQQSVLTIKHSRKSRHRRRIRLRRRTPHRHRNYPHNPLPPPPPSPPSPQRTTSHATPRQTRHPRNGRPRHRSRSKEMVSRRSLAQRSRSPERGGRVGWKECEDCAGAAGGVGCWGKERMR